MLFFKIDENLPPELGTLFVEAGLNVHTVAQEGLRGAPDSAIIDRCQSKGRTLMTLDRDFADIRTYPPENFPEIIVLRVNNRSRKHLLRLMEPVIELLQKEPISGRLWIVSEAGVRIRG